jgi:hypothetical protein
MLREPECSMSQSTPWSSAVSSHEVVAATECADLRERLGPQPLNFGVQALPPLEKPLRGPGQGGIGLELGSGPAVRGEADRQGRLDVEPKPPQRVRKVGGRQRGTHRRHPAADVDTDRRRRDRVPHGDDRADRCALAQVDIGHDRHAVDPGQGADVAELRERLRLDLRGVSPHAGRSHRARHGHRKVDGGHGCLTTFLVKRRPRPRGRDPQGCGTAAIPRHRLSAGCLSAGAM